VLFYDMPEPEIAGDIRDLKRSAKALPLVKPLDAFYEIDGGEDYIRQFVTQT